MVIFYGSVIFSILFVIIALIKRSWLYMLGAMIISLPFSLYLSATPRFAWFFMYPITLLIITFILFKLRQIKKQAL